MEGSFQLLVEVLSQYLAEVTDKTTKAGDSIDIRTEYFPNTREERNRYTNTGLFDIGNRQDRTEL
jgi:hypothetical protein